MHHYGISEGPFGTLDYLNLTSSVARAACFTFTSNNVLQETVTGKCVNRLTDTDRQLILRTNCNGPLADAWSYDSTDIRLIDVSMGATWCFSPWRNSYPPYDITYMPGVSPCAGWNEVFLIPGRCIELDLGRAGWWEKTGYRAHLLHVFRAQMNDKATYKISHVRTRVLSQRC